MCEIKSFRERSGINLIRNRISLLICNLYIYYKYLISIFLKIIKINLSLFDIKFDKKKNIYIIDQLECILINS